MDLKIFKKERRKILDREERKREELENSIALSTSMIAICLLLLDFLLIEKESKLFIILAVIAILLAVIPISFFYLRRQMEIKEIEAQFPRFLRDLAEAKRSGMTLPLALKTVSTNDYGPLSKYVKKMDIQVELGVPFDKALENMGNKTGSALIKRIVSAINQAYMAGGAIEDILDAVAASSFEVEKLRKERESIVHTQLIEGYIIFLLFIVIVVVLVKCTFPLLQSTLVTSEKGAKATEALVKAMPRLFSHMLIIQSIFAGIAVGVMAEGSIKSGLKHSLILLIISLVTIVFIY